MLIKPYLGVGMPLFKKEGLLCCPSDSVFRNGVRQRSYAVAAQQPTGLVKAASGANCVNAGENGGGFAGATTMDPVSTYCYSPGRKLSEFPDTAGTLQLAEMPTGPNYLTSQNTAVVMSPVTNSGQLKKNCGTTTGVPTCGQDGDDAVDIPFHLEGWNYLFVDGHVKWYRPESTKGNGANNKPKGMWTIAEGD